ncbi:MAG: hypothetical protein IKL79_06830 [Clostridia bacterium]|nr:hypothetical protein [Clostridia bacterium]
MGLFDFGKKNKYFKLGEEAYSAGDYERSAEYYRLAMECGHRTAQRFLAFHYRFGLGVAEDVATAYKLYDDLFKKTGEDVLLSHIIEMYYMDELDGILELTDEECFDYAYRGAHAGGERAYPVLAYYYRDGIGCEPNCYLGARWTYEGYRRNFVDSTFELGKMFDDGDGYFPSVPAYAKYFLLRTKELCDEKGFEYFDGLEELLADEKYAKIEAVKPEHEYFSLYYGFDQPIRNYEGRVSPDTAIRIAKAHTIGEDEDGNTVEIDPRVATENYTKAADHYYYVAEYTYALFCYPVGNENPVVDENGELVHLGDSKNLYVNYMTKAANKGDLDAMMELVTASLDKEGPFAGEKWAQRYIPLITSLHGVDYYELHGAEEREQREKDAITATAAKILPEREVHEITATSEFTGIMKGDQRVKGTLVDFVDGWTYEGEFKDNLMTGSGRLTYSDGDVDEGYFEEGRLHGVGIRRSKKHTTWGDFREGKRSGFCIIKQEDGELVAGIYKDSKPNGLLFFRHSDGSEEFGIFNSDFENTSVEAIKRRLGGDIPTSDLADGAIYYGQSDGETMTIHGWGWCFDKRSNYRFIGKSNHSSMVDGIMCYELPHSSGVQYVLIDSKDWRKGEPNGHGTVICFAENETRGFVYSGNMVDGEYSGEGMLRAFDGTTLKAVFEHNEIVSVIRGTKPDCSEMDEKERNMAAIFTNIVAVNYNQ